MGLQLLIVEYKGKHKDGYLITTLPEEDLPFSKESFVIRRSISKNVDFKVLESGIYGDHAEYYRPSNFEEAYKWRDSLENEGDREYITNLLKSLEMNDNYYLEYNY